MTYVIVNRCNEYFSCFVSYIVGPMEDDFASLPHWTTNWQDAHVYESKTGAQRMVKKLGTWTAAIGEEI